jgi:hypothetical protein
MVTPTGLTTGVLPCNEQNFELLLDLKQHQLVMLLQNGNDHRFSLQNISVAPFYKKLWQLFHEVGLNIHIHKKPNEVIDPIAFDKDEMHKTYETNQIESLHRVLLFSQEVLTTFRSSFIGKCSPVQFFWGSFDLAVTRFSGRTAPEHPGGIPNLPDAVAKEAYSHEVSSCGFWPGNAMLPTAAYYTYAYPEPDGFKNIELKPGEAYYHKEMGEFILPYDAVQRATDPHKMVLDFLYTTYEAAAALAGWDRKALEQKMFVKN